jgi:polyisoprenoid-binding protein YceI
MTQRSLLAAAALALVVSQPTFAASPLPPGVYAGQPDYRLAPAGAYAVDPAHTAVIAKVPHIGYSLSVFRFDKVAGKMTWDPGRSERSSLSVTVETASISTPVPGFATELSGAKYLNASAFPKATFVSSRFRRIDATHGRVDGQFSLMGHTHPLTFEVELIGAGKAFMGHPRIGAEATAVIRPQDYGLPPVFIDPIHLVIDAEFAKS